MEEKRPLLHRDFSFKDLPASEKLETVREIVYAAFPNILSSLGTFLKDMISLYYIGHLNNPLLFAAFGFGMTWFSAFGTALVYGLSTGYGTFAAQAYGARNYRKMGILYQKSIASNTIILLCLAVFLWFTRAVLITCGFEEELSSLIGEFIRYLILDLFLFMIFGMTQFYLISQNLFNIPAYILIISTAFHVLWCYLFVNVFEMELVGMAIARTLTDLLSVIMIFAYIRLKNPCPESWFPWVSECLENLGKFVKDLFSYGSSVYMEWVVFELTTMLLGYLGDVTVLAAHSATLNYMMINWTLVLGITLATTVLVGNAVGEGNVRKAKKYSYTGLLMNLCMATILDIFLYFSRENITLFYTEEQSVRSVMKVLLTMYCFAMHADLGCNTFGFILRTLGQDRFVLKGFMISYYGVGVTCSFVSALVFGFGFYGIWISLISGFYVMLGLTVYKFLKLDWEREVSRISHEMKKPIEMEEI